MKVAQIKAAGLENLAIIEQEQPKPAAGQVLIRLKAASVNYRDVVMAGGKYPTVRFPLVPLSDGVGVVEAVGDGVDKIKAGDRVSPIYAPHWLSGPPIDQAISPALGGEVDGVLRQYMLSEARSVVKVPEHLTDEEAATLTVAGVTAWSAVVDYGKVKPGDTVLVEGTGGVALFALQFAKLAGARVAIISSSDEKLERARVLGADVTLNYKETPEWGAAIAKATGGVNLVVETIGATTIPQALQSVARGARVAQIGLMSGFGASLPLQLFVPRGVQMQGILVGGRDRYEEMNRAIGLHKLRPVVSEVHPMSEAAAAIGSLVKGNHFGKIVIKIP
jgi:NADPH:quinone reductase-like Zn-dependent oxidoreductase